jgi:PPE-repeat protein
MSWAATPPEVIGAQIYGGAGITPLTNAAAALGALATELGTAATQWQSELNVLIGTTGWTGTGAAAAQAAAETYIAWLQTTATEVGQAATLAGNSAAAYGLVATPAFPGVGVVDPATVLANRTAQAALVASNVLGVNTMAIAALDTLYAEMWAQDVAAMGVYQSTSLASSALPALVGPDGSVTGISTASDTASDATAAASSTGTAASSLFNSFDGFIGTPAVANTINGGVNTAAWFVMNAIPTAISLGHTLGSVPAIAVGDVVPADGAGITEGLMVGSVTGGGMGMGGVGGLAGAASSASVGEASMVGKLSVPPGWSATAAPATLASSTAPLEGSGWTAAAEAEPVSAMPGMPGAAAAAKGAGAYGTGPRYGTKPIVMPKQVVV